MKANEDFSLELKFNDNSISKFDARPYLDVGVFTELKDIGYFKQVIIAFGTLQWPHEQDISPETLYIESSLSEISMILRWRKETPNWTIQMPG